MAFAFDSLGYAKHLREGGVPQEQAEAHAEAVRDYVIQEIATKADLQAMESKLTAALNQLEGRLTLKLTLRLGAMIAAGVAILAAIVKLT
jgi:hypothetical protein